MAPGLMANFITQPSESFY